MAGYARLQRACLLLCSLAVSNGHTWMFSKGRAWMQASLDAPFRARVTEAGQGTHVQLGPGQTTVLRWASSHNNTFSLAVISAADEEWFYHKDYYKVRALVHIYVVYYVRLVVEGCTSRPLCPSFIPLSLLARASSTFWSCGAFRGPPHTTITSNQHTQPPNHKHHTS